MAGNRKLNRPTDQRNAVLRGLATALITNGRIETTEARAKEVRKVAEKLITLAVNTCDGEVTVTKKVMNDKQQPIDTEFKNDTPERLHARRQVMAYLYNVPAPRKENESKKMYKINNKDVNNYAVSKLFGELAPKYAKRKEELKQGGGYTRMIKKGPRRGDAAEIVILELV